MDKQFIEQLQTITQEEQSYLDGSNFVNKDIYTTKELFEIDHNLFLREGKLIAVRRHSRFVTFPEHNHNYIEIMYVCAGSITHEIDGKEIVLQKGDMLFLNQHVKHSVKRAELGDIGINFIALPEFFDIPLQMLRRQNVIADFLVSTLRTTNPQYLVFQLRDQKTIENLMENMIVSIGQENENEDAINQYSMGLVFLYLMNHMDSLTTDSSQSYQDVILQTTLRYIDTQYPSASLTHLAGEFHQSVSVLSKQIKQAAGVTFQELLIRKRCEKAVALLANTDLPVEEIVIRVGYENQSYFYRLFKAQYGMTPNQYRHVHGK